MLAFAATVLLAVAAITSTTNSVDAQDSAQAFLDLHNAARAEVGVAPLAWDDTAATYAQTFAAQRKGDCALLHSGGPYGENLFWGSAGARWTAADAVASWVAEKQFYNCSSNSCSAAAGQVCRHYTQVVWAGTTRVGCSTVTCDGQSGTFIVCEYDPPGNGEGQAPYAGCGLFNRSAQNSPQDFLSLQNAFRAGLGVGMLSWDSTLASYAETYAEKRKSDCRKISSGGPYGENIFQGAGGAGASDALFSWFGEKQYYNCTTNRCVNGDACGDYTQLIWANSSRVGCASVTCNSNAGGGTFITCNYDPRGNIPGERPYLGCTKAESTTPDNGGGSIPKVNGNSASGNSSSPSRNKSNALILPIILPVVTALGLVSAILVYIGRRSRLKKTLSCTTSSKDIEDLKSVLLDPSVIRVATQNFADGNKLGEGGFGQVYKGLMPDGQEIAVKRLARGSKQGLRELKNELLLVAKLQHRNLVKLIGACLDREEKLLVYEYIPNKSLDYFIYDDEKRDELAWDTRYKIICGIARGLVYLHDESRVKVIHRDLKPSNILLEMDMNPKISDFGLASVFEDNHSKHITLRVAGTYGYMAPEYAVLGHVSTKSDVFSFGVIILEIVTGRRNSVSSSEAVMAQHLLSYVWENWTRGTITEIIDPSLQRSCAENMVLKCAHIGLLCVQENPSDRPNMSNVILMLVGRSTTLPAPSRPAFLFRLDEDQSNHGAAIDLPGHSNKSNLSLNKVTITELEPR